MIQVRGQMPVIQPARLKQQTTHLLDTFNQPDQFVKGVSQLLESYSERAVRSGQLGEPKPLLPVFDVPPPLLPMLLSEFSYRIRNEPEHALAICDRLWVQDYFELRCLAAAMLGKLPTDSVELIIDRLSKWTPRESEGRLQIILLDDGTLSLRRDNSPALLLLARNWLADASIELRRLGFILLNILAQDQKFENLPALYTLLRSPVINIQPEARQDIISLVSSLALRSPAETAFFLRDALNNSDSPDPAWIIRQVILDFPEDIRASLRAAVRQ